jgi:hypothetical protein
MDNMEIAKLIGEPINPAMPVPFELAAIADVVTAEAGEHVWRYSSVETTSDVVLAIDGTNGAITVVKRSPLDDVELTFTGLNSKLEYVLVDAVLGSPDLNILARRKESITRAMDKREVQLIIAAILANTGSYLPGVNCQEYTVVTADDLYDAIIGMKHLVEDYGDQYVLLCGSTVKEAIDTYDKDQAATLHYNVTLTAKLRELGIEVVKVFGVVSSTSSGEAQTALMTATSCILIAKNSRIAAGKPITFVRRKLNPAVAALMGASVDAAQRALVVGQTPVIVSGTNTLAYSIYGYESVIFCITNPYAIVLCDMTLCLS